MSRKSIAEYTRRVDATRAKAKARVLRERLERYLARPDGFEQDRKELHDLIRSPDDVDDATQSYFLGVMESFANQTVRSSHFQRPALAEGVIRQLHTVREEQRDFLRAARGYAFRFDKTEVQKPFVELDDEELVGKRRLLHALAAAIRELPEDRQQLVDIRFRRGFTVPKIARLFGLSEGQVKHRLRHTCEALRVLIMARLNCNPQPVRNSSAVSRLISSETRARSTPCL